MLIHSVVMVGPVTLLHLRPERTLFKVLAQLLVLFALFLVVFLAVRRRVLVIRGHFFREQTFIELPTPCTSS